MTADRRRNNLALALVLTYGFAVMCWVLTVNPLDPGEARTIFMGRYVISELGATWVDAAAPAETMMDAYLGSPAIAPAAAAWADSVMGIYGARLVGAFLGIVLIAVLYMTGNTPQYGGRGLLTAAGFVLLGLPLQVLPGATSDAFAALFLGASVLCVEDAARPGSRLRRALVVLGGSALLALAVMANYIVMLFVLPYAMYVVLRHRPLVAGVFFVVPLFAVLAVYGRFAVLPVWPAVEDSLSLFMPVSGENAVAPWVYVFNLLNMACLLAFVGIFHRDGGKNSICMLLLAAPGLLVNLVGSDMGSMHTAALLSMVFLAPAAALGITKMGDLYSYHNDMRIAKPLFVTAVIVVVWVFGVQQIKGLNRERPDLTSAVAFIEDRSNSCSCLLVDSDYGLPELVYRYYLDAKAPQVHVAPVTRVNSMERRDAVAVRRPDYVVVDSYHSVRSFDLACREYLAQGFTVAATYKMPLASGVKDVLIFQKGTT